MGYYTGSGVVSGGSRDIADIVTVYSGEWLIVLRRTTIKTKTYMGVSLTTATDNVSSVAVTAGNVTSGSVVYPLGVRSGQYVTYNYSRIGDSNLYSKNVSTKWIASKLNSGSWYAHTDEEDL